MDGIRAMQMRGGTSKGLYFLAADLPAGSDGSDGPAGTAERDDLLLRVIGSPDPAQIDGVGGAHPLTSKVAVVSPSTADGIDVDYLFLQVMVDRPVVTDKQNCGNILAGVGPFAVERGLVAAGGARTRVRIRMVNTDGIVTATFPTPGGRPRYDGATAIDGVPGTAAAVVLDFTGTEGSATGALLPTGSVTDVIDGITVTCIDNGMPVVVVPAAELGCTGYETVTELEADTGLAERVLALRLAAGRLMGLGDTARASVPKISLLAAPADGGTICTRTFIPVRVHEAIGVLGAVSVATALLLDGAAGAGTAGAGSAGAGSAGARLAAVTPGQTRFDIEHPTGHLEVEVEMDTSPKRSSQPPAVIRSGVVRTARKLFDGTVFPRRYS